MYIAELTSATARPPGAVLLSLPAVPRFYPKSRLCLLGLLELGRTPSLDSRCYSWDFQPPKHASLRDAGFATLEVALGSASPCPCVAL